MIRAAAYLGLLVLSACAAPQASGPAQPVQPVYQTSLDEGVINVVGPTKSEDDLAAHHCKAAKMANGFGAATVEWIGGVAQPAEVGFKATMSYVMGDEAKKARFDDPEAGGPVLIKHWLPYCDEAGIPREGAA
ncbi:MAG: hypothetical protein AAF401_16190 [Pseudomonadota bacterium]